MQLQGNIEELLNAGRSRRHRRSSAAAPASNAVDDSSVLTDLLLRITDKRSLELDAGLIRRIKSLCKKSDEHIRTVHDFILHALEANHAQVRYHAMEICHQLFQRSHLFRHLTTQHLPQILEHAVGTKASRPLPGPADVANKLHEKALESIDQWTDKFGAYYQQLRVSMRYLKDVLQMQFPQIRARAAAAEAEARARQDRAQDILREKLLGILDTYEETSKEIQSTLAQMNEAFELLMERPDQARAAQGGLPAQDEEGLEWEDVAEEDAAEEEEVEGEDEEGLPGYRDTVMPGRLLGQAAAVLRPDPVVLESLKDLNQLLGGSHMRTVNEWLRILTQVVTGESGSDEDRQRDGLLRRATELRGSISRAQDRYGAVMDVLRATEDMARLPRGAQQDVQASAVAEQEPKAAVPPWLAAQQAAAEHAAMQDLFGASSSDDEKAPAGSSLVPTKAFDESGAEGKGDASAQDLSSVAEAGVPVLKAEEPAESQQGFTQAAGSNAMGGKLPDSASEQTSKKDPKIRSSSRPASANKVGVTVGSSGAGAVDIAEGRIDYARVAERLRQKASGVEGTRDTRKGSAKKRKKHFDPWEPVLESEGPARSGSIGRDAVAEGGHTPRRMEPWGAAGSDEDASMGLHDDSSAASDSTKNRSRPAAPGRGGSAKGKALQPAGSAKLEPKKPTIPEALKQSLAAQAPVVPSGPHLAYWDSKDETLVNARGMQVYNHWGPVDETKTLPIERINELFGSMASYYKPPTEEELAAAAKRKADEDKPVVKDEPLEAQRPKRAKVPSTPILPPDAAKRIAVSATASTSRGPAMPIVPPEAVIGLPAVTFAAAQQSISGKQPAELSEGKPPASTEAVLDEGCSTAHLWPSQAAARGLVGNDYTENGAEDPRQVAEEKIAAEQPIEVEEVEWKPEQPSGSPSNHRVQWAASAQAQESFTPEIPAADVGRRRPRDPEKPGKGQRAMDKAHNDAVLAEAATRDPILAHRWAAQQASKAEEAKKTPSTKKLGVRASLAKKLLSKRAVRGAAFDLSMHDSEAHKELNTNRWEEK